MESKLLSISEAAKLIGVCENTLRDWDIDGKLVAIRTNGNHRRYSLDQIRDYLEKNPLPPDKSLQGYNLSQIKKIEEKWATRLQDVECPIDKRNLAILIDNASYCDSSCSVLTRDQMIWLTKHSWLRSKFRKMVNVQPLLGPCSLVFYLKPSYSGFSIESEAVCAKTRLLNFKMFGSKLFETVKYLYADSIAQEIDLDILKNLPRVDSDSLLDAMAINGSIKFNHLFDFIIAPKTQIHEFRKYIFNFEGVEFHETEELMDETKLVVAGGKYPLNTFSLPIYMPYILAIGPMEQSLTNAVMYRSDWYKGEKK